MKQTLPKFTNMNIDINIYEFESKAIPRTQIDATSYGNALARLSLHTIILYHILIF